MARSPKPDDEPLSLEDIITGLNALDAVGLGRVIHAARDLRAGKVQEAKEAIIARVREEAAALDIDPETLFDRPASPSKRGTGGRRKSRGSVAARFRAPDGTEWSGRGKPPRWLAALEAEGRNREEFRIKERQPDLMERAAGGG